MAELVRKILAEESDVGLALRQLDAPVRKTYSERYCTFITPGVGIS